MSDLNIVILMSRWLHILSAMALIGGAFALLLIRGRLRDQVDAEVYQRAAWAWAPVVHVATALLLLTGGFNFWRLVIAVKVEPIPYHAMFGPKVLLAFLVFFLASALTGRSEGFSNMRSNAGKWLKVICVVGVLIALVSGVMNQTRSPVAPVVVAPATTAGS